MRGMRALAAVTTGEPVRRETMLPGAVLTRVARSHIRVGTFQYLAVRGDAEALRLLADYVIARHYPEAATSPSDGATSRPRRTLDADPASSIAYRQHAAIAGETIDCGTCAFMGRLRRAVNPAVRLSSRATTSWKPRSMPVSPGRISLSFAELLDVLSQPHEDRSGLELTPLRCTRGARATDVPRHLISARICTAGAPREGLARCNLQQFFNNRLGINAQCSAYLKQLDHVQAALTKFILRYERLRST